VKTGIGYFDCRSLRHVLDDLDDIVAHNCTYVVHCLSEADLAFYKETMKEIVAATHEKGLEVWIDPWGVGGTFGGETFSRFVASNPRATQLRSDGKRAPLACPNQRSFRRFMKGWVEAAAYIGADVVLWDEPHWFSGILTGEDTEAWACRCGRCRALFKREYGYDMPFELTEEVQAFRQGAMVDFLTEMSSYARSLGTRNALCVLPSELPELGFSDWDLPASIPAMDIFGTDPYWFVFYTDPVEFVSYYTRKVVELCKKHGKDDHIWVQGFKVPAGREDEIRVAIEAAAANGATNIAAWSYLGCGSMSSFASEQPKVVWGTIGRAYARLLKRLV